VIKKPTDSSDNTAPRVLYLPNEADCQGDTSQVGGRAAFREMEQDGTIKELKVYSFLVDFRVDRKKARSHQNLLDAVLAFQPDIIFWQHPQDFPIDMDLLRAIRTCGSSPLVAYHEADPFDRFYKPLSHAAKTLYIDSDVFFTVALGMARRVFNEVRVHPHFYFSPHCFDRERFGSSPPDPLVVGTKYDAVMFGNIGTRFRVIKQPESMQRVRLARGLAKLFGNRFAAFGRGWPSGTNCHGPFPYGRQTEMIQVSRMSTIWELYPDHTFYFSDRLPIALAAGVPFITNGRKGYDSLFANAPGVFCVDSIEGALDAALYLKSLPIEEIVTIGSAARAWAFENLEVRRVFRRAFDICRREWRYKQRGIEASQTNNWQTLQYSASHP
jgi:hypothetical protein